MSFIVEDGSGRVDANSYASVAAAVEYLTQRDAVLWLELSETQKEVTLVKATDYLEQRYSLRWRGSKGSAEQALAWPRSGATQDGFEFPDNMIPIRVRYATYELAKRAVAGELRPDLSPDKTVVTKEKVGSLEVQYANVELVDLAAFESFPVVTDLIRPLLRSGFGSARVVRS